MSIVVSYDASPSPHCLIRGSGTEMKVPDPDSISLLIEFVTSLLGHDMNPHLGESTELKVVSTGRTNQLQFLLIPFNSCLKRHSTGQSLNRDAAMTEQLNFYT